MINLCFLYGKVINEIDLKFIYNDRNKSLDKKHISIVEMELKLLDGQVIKLHAYNEVADDVFKNINKDDFITIQGKIRNNYVEIEKIMKNREST